LGQRDRTNVGGNDSRLTNVRIKKIAAYCVCVVVALLIAGELAFRFGLGFCDALLYRASDKYEYIAQPSQDRHRFGAHIHYNAYSQRNEEEPDTAARRIVLGLGDSVLFGGTMIDQDSLASTLFTRETGMLMLNISAGSWGPDNCAAYIKEKGTFNAAAMVLVCSSHDAYDCMSFMPVVGVYPSYPDRQYRVAWIELFDRYIIPKIKSCMTENHNGLDPDKAVLHNKQTKNYVAKKSATFNKGFGQLLAISKEHGIPFFVYLHAELGELEDGKYNEMGQEIIKWAKANNVSLTQGLREGENSGMYRDNIHMNEKGQRFLADMLKQMVVVSE